MAELVTKAQLEDDVREMKLWFDTLNAENS